MDRQEKVRLVRDRAELGEVLSLVLDLVSDHADPTAAGPGYRLVGTAAALAQGVQLPVGDVDILVALRAEVDRFAAALSGYPCLAGPVWLPEARQYFARFAVNEVDVEVSTVERPVDTDTHECLGRGPWDHHVDLSLGDHVVPAVRLELRLVSEIVRGRADRYAPLVAHLRRHGCDRQLVVRAMRDRGVDPVAGERVLARLQPR